MRRPAYEDALDLEDEDDLDERGLLRDGRRRRVPMMLMDAEGQPQRGPFRPVQPLDSLRGPYRGGHASVCGVTDALGHPAGSRPGHLFTVDADTERAKIEAWESVGQRLRDAWRQQPPERPAVQQGRAQERRDDLGGYRSASPPPRPSTSSSGGFDQEARDAADRAWMEKGDRMRDAWRS